MSQFTAFMKKVEFFFDFASATSYLAYTQLPKIAAARKAEIIWRPLLLGAVFKATGNVSPVTVAAKGRWMFDIDRMLALVSDPAVKQQLKTNTDEAVARGVFGAPTFFVGDQMFFGQDRLEFVAQALDRAAA